MNKTIMGKLIAKNPNARHNYTIEETIEALKKEPPIKYPHQYGDIQIIIEKHYFSDEYAYCKVTFNRKWEIIKIETSKE